jgi:hypothetical protein
LEDEPTLVRAVKAVKRTMAQDHVLRDGYFNTITSLLSVIVVLISYWTNRLYGGVSIAFILLGIGRICNSRRKLTRIGLGISSILFGMGLGLPISGFEIPYHPILLRIYHPTIQSLTHNVGIILLQSILFRDIGIVIAMKLAQWRRLKEEEIKRQEKLRGIFYTPKKAKGGGVSGGRNIGLRSGR